MSINKVNLFTLNTPALHPLIPQNGLKSIDIISTDDNLSHYKAISTDLLQFTQLNNKCPKETQSKADELRQKLNEAKAEQGFIGKVWDGIKGIFGGGSKGIEEDIVKLENGEISAEEIEKNIADYKEGQNMCVDVVGDIVSGICSVGAFVLAVPTGGASLAAGLAVATAVGAGTKIAVKASDAATAGREYSMKDMLYDTATGAINGVLAPVTNGIGASITKSIGQKLGLTIIKEGSEEVIEQGVKTSLKSMILNQGVKVSGGSLVNRAIATGAGMAVDGALGGSADNMVRAALNGENILKAGVQGAIGGLILAPVIGGGFKVMGKAGRALATNADADKVLPVAVAGAGGAAVTAPVIAREMNAASKVLNNLDVPNVRTVDTKLTSEQIERGIRILAPENTPEAAALASIVDESLVAIRSQDDVLDLFRRHYQGLDNCDDVVILNPSSLEKVANKNIGTSNSYMSHWYAEANGLPESVVCNRETIEHLISEKIQAGSKKITIIIPDDFAGSGRSMIVDTAETMNKLNIPDDVNVELVFSPLVSTPNAKNGFDAVANFDKDLLNDLGILNMGGKSEDLSIMTTFFDKYKSNIDIKVSGETIEALPFYSTPSYLALKEIDPDLADAINVILTNNGTRGGYGRNGANGTFVVVPGADGSLKTPNNNTYGAAPFAISVGVDPSNIKRPTSKVPIKKWEQQMRRIQEEIFKL